MIRPKCTHNTQVRTPASTQNTAKVINTGLAQLDTVGWLAHIPAASLITIPYHTTIKVVLGKRQFPTEVGIITPTFLRLSNKYHTIMRRRALRDLKKRCFANAFCTQLSVECGLLGKNCSWQLKQRKKICILKLKMRFYINLGSDVFQRVPNKNFQTAYFN